MSLNKLELLTHLNVCLRIKNPHILHEKWSTIYNLLTILSQNTTNWNFLFWLSFKQSKTLAVGSFQKDLETNCDVGMKKIWYWALQWYWRQKIPTLNKREILTVSTWVSHKDLMPQSQPAWVSHEDLMPQQVRHSGKCSWSMWNLQNLFTEADNQSLAGEEGGNVHQGTKICSHKSKLYPHPAHGDSS